jgi:hypothetical protein
MKTFRSRNGQPFTGTAQAFHRANDLPYGRWIGSDGREVLFNHFYEPIAQRQPGGELREADPAERIAWKVMEHFYTDADTEPSKRGKASVWLNAFRRGGRIDLKPDCRRLGSPSKLQAPGHGLRHR